MFESFFGCVAIKEMEIEMPRKKLAYLIEDHSMRVNSNNNWNLGSQEDLSNHL